jgi:hypothetical protein
MSREYVIQPVRYFLQDFVDPSAVMDATEWNDSARHNHNGSQHHTVLHSTSRWTETLNLRRPTAEGPSGPMF